jgi:hypothetical protein
MGVQGDLRVHGIVKSFVTDEFLVVRFEPQLRMGLIESFAVDIRDNVEDRYQKRDDGDRSLPLENNPEIPENVEFEIFSVVFSACARVRCEVPCRAGMLIRFSV